jgi:hypothetical protein
MAFAFILFAGGSIALVVVRRPHLRRALRRLLKPKAIAATIQSERRQ